MADAAIWVGAHSWADGFGPSCAQGSPGEPAATHVLLNMRGVIQSPADRLLETPVRLPEPTAIASAPSQPIAQLIAPSIASDPNDPA